jgi:diguanylate cyclase (GGDEF)-like protein
MSNYEESVGVIKVLVVDDNPNNITAIKSILAELPIEIHSTASGEEALKIVLRHNFAVIYLDVNMPEMDGYEVATCLSQYQRTSTIPIVFVTAIYNEMEHVLKGYESGAIDYLSKPINAEVLLAKTRIYMKLFEQQERLSLMVKKLDTLANNDALTGLPNRYGFNCFLEKTLANAKRQKRSFALLLLDLDNFKNINDSLGHDVGDKLLVEVAKRLQHTLRTSDFISRLGGDEFCILLTELRSAKDVRKVGVHISEVLAEYITIEQHDIKISTSIGIAVYPIASDSSSGLYKAADIALYRAKDKGKNKFEYYTKSLNEYHQRRLKVEMDLEKAINNSDIYLEYQPRVDMRTGEVIGVEALARWVHKELGDISPTEFITVAEEVGLISDLGIQILSMAFMQFNEWEKEKLNSNFTLAINISPSLLLVGSFLKSLKQLVSTYKIDLSKIEFEVTESIFKGDHNELENILNKVVDMGAAFSIDDFGTGYSSMSRLKCLPIKVLKIDQSFVRDVTNDPNDAAIVKAIIALAAALKLDVIAEGVETKAQSEFLLNNSCYIAQGYYYSRPLSVNKTTKILKSLYLKGKDSTD